MNGVPEADPAKSRPLPGSQGQAIELSDQRALVMLAVWGWEDKDQSLETGNKTLSSPFSRPFLSSPRPPQHLSAAVELTSALPATPAITTSGLHFPASTFMRSPSYILHTCACLLALQILFQALLCQGTSAKQPGQPARAVATAHPPSRAVTSCSPLFANPPDASSLGVLEAPFVPHSADFSFQLSFTHFAIAPQSLAHRPGPCCRSNVSDSEGWGRAAGLARVQQGSYHATNPAGVAMHGPPFPQTPAPKAPRREEEDGRSRLLCRPLPNASGSRPGECDRERRGGRRIMQPLKSVQAEEGEEGAAFPMPRREQ